MIMPMSVLVGDENVGDYEDDAVWLGQFNISQWVDAEAKT